MSNSNNQVTLTGNLGSEAKQHIAANGKEFSTFSLYTQKSYKDEKEEWVNLPSALHNIITFKPSLIANLKNFKKGSRLKITGEITYRPFEVNLDDGTVIKKYEASIRAESVENAALYSTVTSSLEDA